MIGYINRVFSHLSFLWWYVGRSFSIGKLGGALVSVCRFLFDVTVIFYYAVAEELRALRYGLICFEV